MTQRISLTGQSAAVDDVLTGVENLIMLGRLSGLSRTAREEAGRGAARPLRTLRMPPSKRVGAYSGGMRRRLDLALSFVVTPEVLFLDEPTTGLDTRSRRELWDVIRSLAEAGTTVFLTTQYLEEADQLADRIAVLDGGRVVASGTAAQLKGRVGGDTVELHDEHGELLREVPTNGTVSDLRRALDVLDESGAKGVVTLRRPSLDDVFLALTSPDAARRRARRREGDRMTAIAPAAPGIRPRITGLTAESVFVTRSLRHSLRDGESLLMAIMLPVMLMLLFTFVFGGAIDPSGGYVELRRPGNHPALCGVRRSIHRCLRRGRHEGRHHRPVPHDAASCRAPCSPGTWWRASCATSSRRAS